MAQETILSLSLKEYKSEIDALRASLLGLAKDSEEYKQTASECRDMQEKLNQVLLDTKKDTAAVEGSYNALTQELAQLRKEWKSTGDEARRNEIGKQMASLNSQLKELDASVGNFQRSVGNYEIAGQSLKSELRQQEEELARLIAQGYSPASAEVQALVRQTGALKDAMSTAKALTTQYSNDLQGLSTVLDVTKTAAAGYGVWQGALAMFGVENEKVNASLKKLMAAQTMLNSLQTFSKALVDEQSATYRVWNTLVQWVTKSKKEQKVAEDALTASEVKENAANLASVSSTKASTAASKAATTQNGALATSNSAVATTATAASTSMKLLRAALAGLGIGAIIAVISLLVEKLGIFNKQAKESKEGVDDFTSGMADAITQADLLSMSLDDVIKKMLMTEALKQSEEALKGYLKTMVESVRKSKQLSKEIANADKAAANATNTTTTATIQGTLPMQVTVQDNAKDRAEQRARDLRKERSDANKAYNAAMHEYNDEIEVLKTVNDGLTALTESYKDNTNSKKGNTKATNGSTSATKEETLAIESNLGALKEEIRYRKELRNAQGKGSKILDIQDDIELLEAEGKELSEMLVKYKNYYNSLSENDERREKAYKSIKDTEAQIAKNNNDTEIANARLTTEKLTEEYKKRKDAFAGYMTEQNREIELMFASVDYTRRQIETSSLPLIDFSTTTNKDRLEEMRSNIIALYEKLFAESNPIIADSLRKSIDDLNAQYQEEALSIAQTINYSDLYARQSKLMDESSAQFDKLRTKSIGKVEGLTKDTDYTESLALMRQYYQGILDETRAFTNEETREKTKAQEALMIIDSEMAADYANRQDQAFQIIKNALEKEKKDLYQRLASAEEGSNNYKTIEADIKSINDKIAQIEMDRAKAVADYNIEQQERVNENAKKSAESRVKHFEAEMNAAVDAADAIGGLMSTIADGRKDNLERLLDEGKITEEEYKNRFEQIKKMELASLWVSTLAGAVGAFLQDKKAYPAPWNYIIGGIDMATTFATGVAQHRAIAAQTYDSASKGSGGGTKQVSVSPLLNEQLDMSTLSSINTQEIADNTSNRQDTRVYILQQDIAESQTQVEVREQNTTF